MNTEATSPATRHSGDWHPDEKDAFSVEETAHKLDLGRSIIYRALNPDPAKRGQLPHLPSLKVGKRRLIRTEARRAWLKQLEELESADTKSALLHTSDSHLRTGRSSTSSSGDDRKRPRAGSG